jgi:hypothetical protein
MKSKFSDDPKAKHFQIRFCDKDGCGSFYYFSALPKENIGEKAVDIANVEYLQKEYENAHFRSFGAFTAIKIVAVVQYDREKKGTLKGGIKFKIRLKFVQYTLGNGRKERREWYEADEITEHQSKKV